MGAAAFVKPSAVGKDLLINATDALAQWAQGVPSTGISGNTTKLTGAGIASNFGLTPAGQITSQVMTNSATAADSLSQIFMGLLGQGRAGMAADVAKTVCGFYGDSAVASPTFGASLFEAAQVSALTSAITVGSLSAEQQALLAAFYQSAMGTVGGVIIQQDGCDYHGQPVPTVIAPSDLERGQMVAMFIAANYIAQTPGALMMVSNGQAIANGAQSVTVNGVTMNGPIAQGDAGGSANGGFLLCYHPSSPPVLNSTGTLNTTTGNFSSGSTISSVPEAMASLYYSAFAYLGLDLTTAAAKMAEAGISNPVNLLG
jgi:hypothetical protein